MHQDGWPQQSWSPSGMSGRSRTSSKSREVLACLPIRKKECIQINCSGVYLVSLVCPGSIGTKWFLIFTVRWQAQLMLDCRSKDRFGKMHFLASRYCCFQSVSLHQRHRKSSTMTADPSAQVRVCVLLCHCVCNPSHSIHRRDAWHSCLLPIPPTSSPYRSRNATAKMILKTILS